jgi:hypothetical protein
MKMALSSLLSCRSDGTFGSHVEFDVRAPRWHGTNHVTFSLGCADPVSIFAFFAFALIALGAA